MDRTQLLGGALQIKVTGHADGFALRELGTDELHGSFPNMHAAIAARDAAREALAQLAACLAKPRA